MSVFDLRSAICFLFLFLVDFNYVWRALTIFFYEKDKRTVKNNQKNSPLTD